MSRISYRANATADRSLVVLEIYEDEKALAHILLDGAMTEGLIQRLADCRAALIDPVTPSLDPGTHRIHGPVDPAWLVTLQHGGPRESVLLALRHPGMGWLGYFLPAQEAEAVTRALHSCARPDSEDQ